METNARDTRIAEIERLLFIMEFKDHWTREDWAERAALTKELEELRNAKWEIVLGRPAPGIKTLKSIYKILEVNESCNQKQEPSIMSSYGGHDLRAARLRLRRAEFSNLYNFANFSN